MTKQTNTDSFGYHAPEVSEIIVCSEGVLCGSYRPGETNDLSKEDLGDIWY